MTLWLIIIGMGLITFVIRLILFLLLERVQITAVLQRALQFVPTAVLSAIIFPELLQPGGTFDLSLGNFRLLAGLGAIGIAWATRNVLATIAGGMIILWLLQWIY
jgi:branched-subunit amino acid transport protein